MTIILLTKMILKLEYLIKIQILIILISHKIIKNLQSKEYNQIEKIIKMLLKQNRHWITNHKLLVMRTGKEKIHLSMIFQI